MNQQPPTGMMNHPPPPPPPPTESTTQAVADNPVVVIAPQYCTPCKVDLRIAKKVEYHTECNHLGAFDTNGKKIFKVTSRSYSSCRILVDAAGVPLVSLKPKDYTFGRWYAYRGDTTDSENLLFSVKKSKLFQFKTNLDVFLESNKTESVCDFKMKQSYNRKSCVIYRGGSKNIIAEMHKRKTVQGKVLGKDTFSVTIYPNIDNAFVIALRVVLDEMNTGGGGGEDGDGDDRVFGSGCGG